MNTKTQSLHGRQGADRRDVSALSLQPLAFPRRGAAFSLLEMIGVMAIAVIIALAFALTTTKSIDRAFATNESTILQNFAYALQNSVLRNVYIPGSNDMPQVIATEMGVGLNMVQNTDRRNARVFFVDPAFTINTTNCGSGYNQTTDGAYSMANPYRILILSSISLPLPKISVSSANFSTIWTTQDGYIPTGSADFNGWGGNPGDVIIQRINLTPLFVNLQLSRDSSGATAAQYLIQGQPATPLVVPSGGINSYYIQNSLVTLINGVSPAGTNAELMLSRSFSFFYVQGFWRSTPYPPVAAPQTAGASADLASAIAIAAAMFVNSPYNTTATAGTTPPQVLNAMSNFMAAYPNYADWVVNSNSGNWVAPPATNLYAWNVYTNASTWQSILATNMGNLVTPAGSGSGNGNVSPNGCTNGPSM